MASKPIYQIYAELEEYEPKIWRRFQVMNDITVARLAYILMTLFEMKGSHLYKFEVNELENSYTWNLNIDDKKDIYIQFDTGKKVIKSDLEKVLPYIIIGSIIIVIFIIILFSSNKNKRNEI